MDEFNLGVSLGAHISLTGGLFGPEVLKRSRFAKKGTFLVLQTGEITK